MRLFFLAAMLATSPTHAATFRCMPIENCINDQCKPAVEPDQSFLLINSDGPAPILRSKGNDTGMTKLAGNALLTWKGGQQLADGEIRIALTLAIAPADLTYTLSQLGEFGQGVSTGQCEAR